MEHYSDRDQNRKRSGFPEPRLTATTYYFSLSFSYLTHQIFDYQQFNFTQIRLLRVDSWARKSHSTTNLEARCKKKYRHPTFWGLHQGGRRWGILGGTAFSGPPPPSLCTLRWSWVKRDGRGLNKKRRWEQGVGAVAKNTSGHYTTQFNCVSFSQSHNYTFGQDRKLPKGKFPT